ncbi:dienelactone hydrolase family protein [Lineolata rhizophorae]|uniref:Dienelactone hydrolase family protein n=1 Tax=Lineolata rhizophorae TaxID=578093 RepID=A0A6A6P4D4_9PEZI|nr:dienelactone hydrolase family protein [Lineolata rhizophorae]
MTSHPPGECCFSGSVHEGTPVGEMTTLGQVSAYVSRPPNDPPKKALIYFADGYGIPFINNQLLADAFASHGYLVIMPDLLDCKVYPPPGPARPSGLSVDKWLAQHPVSRVDPVVQATIAALQAPPYSMPASRTAALGYCFGAKYLIRHLRSENMAAGYVAHPSFVTAEELRGIRCPLSIAAAEQDDIFTDEKRKETEGILREVGAERGLKWTICMYSGTRHSFAVRADQNDERASWAAEEAMGQALRWVKQFIAE